MRYFISYIVIWMFSFTSIAQHPSDAWETRLNNIQPPEKVLKSAGIEKGMIVGELGAGTGRYAVKIAEKVGADGLVYANDIDQDDLNYLDSRCERDYIKNIKTVIGEINDPLFPVKDLDVLFLINTYHHLDNPYKILSNAIEYLKPGGSLVIVEADPEKKESLRHNESTKKEKLIDKVKEAGYEFVRVETYLVRDNIYIFRRPGKQ